MESIRIEILNPKALQLIEGMQALNLIKITKDSISKARGGSKKQELGQDDEERQWKNLSSGVFLQGYSDDEPEYTEGDIKEPNPEYKKAWKEK